MNRALCIVQTVCVAAVMSTALSACSVERSGGERAPSIHTPLLGETVPVVQVAAGGDHTCALLEGGTVSCWGSNVFGQLGDGTTTDRGMPTDVPGLTGATQIGAGRSSTCALLADGTAKCWGYNDYGQVG